MIFIRSFQFSRKVANYLISSTIKIDFKIYRVSGYIDLGSTYARIEVGVWNDFNILKSYPPLVWCREPWMRDCPDWHNSAENGLCWILGKEWYDGMNWEGKTPCAIINEGSEWLIMNVRSLIGRHYVGHLKGIDIWPSDWECWSHSEKGIKEYEREKKRRQ